MEKLVVLWQSLVLRDSSTQDNEQAAWHFIPGYFIFSFSSLVFLLSPDLPTVVSDLPTVVSGFTYFRLRIYLPLQDEKSGAEKSGDEKVKDETVGGGMKCHAANELPSLHLHFALC